MLLYKASASGSELEEDCCVLQRICEWIRVRLLFYRASGSGLQMTILQCSTSTPDLEWRLGEDCGFAVDLEQIRLRLLFLVFYSTVDKETKYKDCMLLHSGSW